MPADQRISVRVAADGTITAETHGIAGSKCLDYIAVLEELLHATTTSSRFTADYDLLPTTMTHDVAEPIIEEDR